MCVSVGGYIDLCVNLNVCMNMNACVWHMKWCACVCLCVCVHMCVYGYLCATAHGFESVYAFACVRMACVCAHVHVCHRGLSLILSASRILLSGVSTVNEVNTAAF